MSKKSWDKLTPEDQEIASRPPRTPSRRCASSGPREGSREEDPAERQQINKASTSSPSSTP